MITAERKPMEDLIRYVSPYRRILLVGCNECVTVCSAGGRKEVGLLSSALQLHFMKEAKPFEIKEITLERQCDPEYIEELVPHHGSGRRGALNGLRMRCPGNRPAFQGKTCPACC